MQDTDHFSTVRVWMILISTLTFMAGLEGTVPIGVGGLGAMKSDPLNSPAGDGRQGPQGGSCLACKLHLFLPHPLDRSQSLCIVH